MMKINVFLLLVIAVTYSSAKYVKSPTFCWAAKFGCPDNKVLHIRSAFYGRLITNICRGILEPEPGVVPCTDPNSLDRLREKCQGKKACNIPHLIRFFETPTDACPKTNSYLKVTYTCEDSPLIEGVACKHNMITPVCPPGQVLDITYASYGRHDNFTCYSHDAEDYFGDCHSDLSLPKVTKECNGKNSCGILAKSNFGNPCYGTTKYLSIRYRCFEAPKTSVACQKKTLSLSCPKGQFIIIESASYGRSDKTTCANGLIETTDCHHKDSFAIVHNKCFRKQSCTIKATNKVFGNPCGDTVKYLKVKYFCLRKK